MMLNGGALELTDVNGGKIFTMFKGVKFNHVFNATFTTLNQVINLPPQAVGKKGILSIKATCIVANTGRKGYLNNNYGVAFRSNYTQGNIEISNYDLDTLPSTMNYKEYLGRTLATDSPHYRIEIKIYY